MVDKIKIGCIILLRSIEWIPDKLFLSIYYRIFFNKKLNWKNPKTFQEKIQWLKIHSRKNEYTKLVDKIEVKKWVAERVGRQYIIPTLGIWNNPDDIDWGYLPDKFVIKTNHAGGNTGVIIVRDKSVLNIQDAVKKLKKSLKKEIYKDLKEWPYKNIKKRILAEKLLEDCDNSELSDYKFFCFNGIPKYCQVIADRRAEESIDFYDMEWKRMEFTGLIRPDNPPKRKIHNKPDNFDEMINIASKLSVNIPFLRVDLYNIKGKIYFGELTFFPASGFGFFFPSEWDYRLGDLIRLKTK